MYHIITPPGAVFQARLLDNQEGAPNDTSSESSLQNVSNADLFGTDTIPTAVEISTMEKTAQRGVTYTIVCGTLQALSVCALPLQLYSL